MKFLPNLLTLLRVALVPLIGLVLYLPQIWAHWLAFFLFISASLTDYADGRIAREYNTVSKLGQLLDPVADKIVVISCLLFLTDHDILTGWHLTPVFIIICREFFISGLREQFSAKSNLTPTFLPKWKTALQMISLSFLFLDTALSFFPARLVGLALLWLASFLSVWTGLRYWLKT